jgi:iron(III) transport system ATP-binding protein
VILLDEPFSALDAALRNELRRDVRSALRADGVTSVLVTHDQGEALSIADSLAVMRDGFIVQSGTPAAVYAKPADPWVAGFVGEAVWLPAGHPILATVATSGSGTRVLARPEQITLLDGADAIVLRRDFHGHDAVLALRLHDGTEITSRVVGHATPSPGDSVAVRIDGPVRAY